MKKQYRIYKKKDRTLAVKILNIYKIDLIATKTSLHKGHFPIIISNWNF